MTPRTWNAIALVLGLLGLGGIVVDQQVYGLPSWAQWVVLVLSVGLMVWRRLPDLNDDGTPDVFAGFWPWLRSRLPWLVVLMALAMPACSGVQSAEPFVWESIDMSVEATPEGAKGDVGIGVAFWGVPVDVTIHYTNGAIAACATVNNVFPVCVKRAAGDESAEFGFGQVPQ